MARVGNFRLIIQPSFEKIQRSRHLDLGNILFSLGFQHSVSDPLTSMKFPSHCNTAHNAGAVPGFETGGQFGGLNQYLFGQFI